MFLKLSVRAILANFKFYRLSTGYSSPTLNFLVECRCCCTAQLERFKVLMNHVYTASVNTALFGIHKRVDLIACSFSYFLAKQSNALPDVIRTSAFTEFKRRIQGFTFV